MTTPKIKLPKFTLSVQGELNQNGDFDWGNAIVDAAIVTMITAGGLIATILSDGAFNVPELGTFMGVVLTEFFGFIGIKRKLVNK